MAFLSFQARVGLPVTMFQLLQFILASPISHFERQTATIPSYVLEYGQQLSPSFFYFILPANVNSAPLVWLDTQEQYQPSDIGAQLVNTRPEDNFTVVTSAPNPLTLDNLASLNALGGTDIYLTSIDDITTNPAWLNGVAPDSSGKTDGATSCTIIVNDHGSGLVDAFFMYFYAYNQGNTVLGQEIGDHVGDWEHNMIRFSNGVPQEVWYSQHEDGEAFTYDCLEKQGVRPITYSARGTHANYAINGYADFSADHVSRVLIATTGRMIIPFQTSTCQMGHSKISLVRASSGIRP